MIELKNISQSFQDGKNIRTVLNDINFTIEDSDFITIMGESGSGKSTLLNISSLLLKPTNGEVYLNGELVNFKKKNDVEKKRQQNIGMVFQTPNLIPSLNVMENINLVVKKNTENYVRQEDIKEYLRVVGLGNRMKDDVKTLSGGEAQRVAIIRALINKPKILFCDEPTGSLDEETGQNIMDVLTNLHNDFGCSLVIVTHDKSIGRLGDKQYLLDKGKLVTND